MFWLIEVFRKWILGILNVLIVFFISVFPVSATSIISIYEHGYRCCSSVDLKIEREARFNISENELANCCQNQQDIVDYRDWGIRVEAVAAKGVQSTALVTKYPANTAIASTAERTFLMPGQVIDRYGALGSKWF